MNERSELFVGSLGKWRLRNVDRDWEDVVSRATAAASSPTGRLGGPLGLQRSRRWRIVVVAVALAVAAPAIAAAFSDVFSWPSSHRPGARLVASVPSLPGTSLRLDSHGALVVRTSHGIRFLSPVSARQKRRFAWQLATESRIAVAEIVLRDAPAVELCSPCSNGRGGTFTLAGSRALDVLNGRAKLRVRSDGRTTTSPIRLSRLR
jgi:hypothetical protein